MLKKKFVSKQYVVGVCYLMTFLKILILYFISTTSYYICITSFWILFVSFIVVDRLSSPQKIHRQRWHTHKQQSYIYTSMRIHSKQASIYIHRHLFNYDTAWNAYTPERERKEERKKKKRNIFSNRHSDGANVCVSTAYI